MGELFECVLFTASLAKVRNDCVASNCKRVRTITCFLTLHSFFARSHCCWLNLVAAVELALLREAGGMWLAEKLVSKEHSCHKSDIKTHEKTNRMTSFKVLVLFFLLRLQYADPVSDLLDKWGAFRCRLFRESCVFHRGNYVKDLSRLGRDLNKVIIVDNSPASYVFHPDNAVSIPRQHTAPQSWRCCGIIHLPERVPDMTDPENASSVSCFTHCFSL